MNGDLQQIGAVLASHVEMAKGFMGERFAVSIMARDKQGPFHLLLGDDAELSLIQCLGELMRQGKTVIGGGHVSDDPEPSPADHMVNLLRECAERLQSDGASTEARDDNELASRIYQVLGMVEGPTTAEVVAVATEVSDALADGALVVLGGSAASSATASTGHYVTPMWLSATTVQSDPLRALEPDLTNDGTVDVSLQGDDE